MNRRDFLSTSLTALALPVVSIETPAFAQSSAAPPLPAPGADGWIQLFNGRNLDNLYTCLRTSGVNNDPQGYVKVEDGMLRLMGNPLDDQPTQTGFVASTREFDDYHVRVEYKWGEIVHPPGVVTRRDNGLLYRITGPDVVFPTCVEFQIVQGMYVGDANFLGGSRGTQGAVEGFPSRGHGPAAPVGGVQGVPGASGGRGGRGRGGAAGVTREGDFDHPNDWNVVEVIMRGDQAVHIVNGTVVATITNLQRPDPQNPGSFLPLTRGKVGMQLYYSEIFVRRIAVRPL
jgi:hypothetical protein